MSVPASNSQRFLLAGMAMSGMGYDQQPQGWGEEGWGERTVEVTRWLTSKRWGRVIPCPIWVSVRQRRSTATDGNAATHHAFISIIYGSKLSQQLPDMVHRNHVLMGSRTTKFTATTYLVAKCN